MNGFQWCYLFHLLYFYSGHQSYDIEVFILFEIRWYSVLKTVKGMLVVIVYCTLLL